jgi:fibronectin-binding autotransporter adhesin
MKTRKILRTAALLAVAWTSTQAQSIWTGANGTLWNDAGNWNTLPAANSTLTFNGSTNTNTSNDFPTNTQFNGIVFSNSTGTSAFTLGGNAIILGGTIGFTGNTTSAITHVIDQNLVLNGNRTINLIANAVVQINGVISDTGGNWGLLANSVSNTSGRLVLNNPANTFGGFVDLQKYHIQVSKLDDTGNASSLGTGNGTALIKLGQQSFSTVLEYTGNTASSTNRPLQIGQLSTNISHNSSPLIKNNAADPAHSLVFTANPFNTPTTQNSTITRTLTLGGNNTGNNTVAGVIQNNTGGTISLTKADSGLWILSGNNTYGGNTTINGGTVVADNAGALGSAGNITFGGGILRYTANSSTADWSSRIKNSTQKIVLDTNGQNVTLGNAIDSTNTNGLTKNGAGALTLSGNNSYTGSTVFNAGQLNLNHANALGLGNSTVTWSNGTTIDNTGGGAVALNNNSAWSLGNGSADQTFAFGGSNDLDLGTGQFSLSNQIDKTLVLNGNRTLTMGTVFSARNGNNNLNVSQGTGSGAQLVLRGLELNSNAVQNTAKTLTLDTDVMVTITGAVIDGINATFANSLAKRGNGTLILEGNNTYTAGTTVAGGTLQLGAPNTLPLTTRLLVQDGTLDLNGFNQELPINAATASTLLLGGVSGGTPAIQTGNGTLTLSAVVDVNSTPTFGYDAAGNSSGALVTGKLLVNTTGNYAGNFRIDVEDSTATGEELTISADIGSTAANAGLFITTGEGTLVLSGNNTFDPSGLTIRGARVVLAADALAGSGTLGTGAETVGIGHPTQGWNAALLLQEGVVCARNLLIYQNDGNPSLLRTLGGVNTAGNATFTGTVDLNGSLRLAAETGGTVLFTNAISGANASFTVNKTGNGTVVLSANNTYAANTTVSEGVLSLASGDAIPDANTLVIDGGKVNLAASETVGVLVLGNTTRGNSTYGSTSSAAAVTNNTYFSGTGILTVGDGGGGPPPVSFAAWALSYNVTNSTTANDDGDKFTHGEEYAFDLDPTADELGNVLASQTALANGNVTLTLAFSGNSAKSDINYVVRRANNPGFTANTVVGFWNGTANWTTSNATYFGNETQTGAGDVKDINVNLAIPAASEPRQFLKVNIE